MLRIFEIVLFLTFATTKEGIIGNGAATSFMNENWGRTKEELNEL
jgi:hypothetical protein